MYGVLHRVRRRLRRASRVVAVVLAGTALCSAAARAQNATWDENPENGNFNNQFNWTPNTVPTGTASFNTSSTTSLTFSTNTTVGGLTLNPGASNYTFVNFNFNQTLQFNGAGIVVNGGGATIVNNTNGAIISFLNSSTAGSAAIFNGTALNNFPTLLFLDTSTAGSATITNSLGSTVFEDSSTAGSATLTNNGSSSSTSSIIEFENNSTAGRAAIINNNSGCGAACSINLFNASTAANATITNNAGSYFSFNDTSTAGSAAITNNGGIIQFYDTSTAGNATITNNSNSVMQFMNSSTAGSATIINNSGICNSCSIDFFNTSTAGNATITNNNSSIIFGDGSTAGNAAITNNKNSSIVFADDGTAGSATIANNNSTITFQNNSTAGSAAITNNAGGVVDFSLTSGPAGNHQISAGSIAGAGNFYLGANALTVGSNNLSATVSGVISDCGTVLASCATPGVTGGSLVKIGAGTLTLSGANTYTGPTNINSGTLDVTGSIASSSLTAVASGVSLTGTGTVGATHVNDGGTFAPGSGTPGTSMTVAGNLAFQSGAQYAVFLNPSASSFTSVTGTASLNGTVNAAFAPGSYVTKQYTILQSAGLGGTTFAGLSNTNLPAHVTDNLSYSADDVFLNLTAALPTGGLNQNQLSVANAFNNFFNSGGTLPPGFVALFNLTGANLANALSQLDGENATGAEHAAYGLMNEFMELMLRGEPLALVGGGGPIFFAPDQEPSFPPDIALAYASVLKAPPKPTFEQRWTAWGSAFGGSNQTNGDPVVGSNNVTTSTYGYAAGMDYHVSPDTVMGFALAGGGTNWELAQGLGGGRSDAFQAGVYGTTRFGPAYVAAALAISNSWFATNRIALGDQLNANFVGQDYDARLEAGYRFAVPVYRGLAGIAPYAAVQVQNFHTPGYSETDLTAGGFGLSYAAMTGTDTRSELGARFDDPTLLSAMPLILRAKVAWAHDWVSNPALNASFESLPGTSFTVFGAPIPRDSALTSVGAQLFFTPNWSLLAKFDGEFASGSQTYAGTGTLRYTW
jgi:autotransporter-associated beta strand protein